MSEVTGLSRECPGKINITICFASVLFVKIRCQYFNKQLVSLYPLKAADIKAVLWPTIFTFKVHHTQNFHSLCSVMEQNVCFLCSRKSDVTAGNSTVLQEQCPKTGESCDMKAKHFHLLFQNQEQHFVQLLFQFFE